MTTKLHPSVYVLAIFNESVGLCLTLVVPQSYHDWTFRIAGAEMVSSKNRVTE